MKISIIVPLHNKARYIGETISSLRAQLHANWEAIVVENNSSDDGPGIVHAISGMDPRIQLHVATANVKGPGAARNYGLLHASGEWVLFLDADDLLLHDHLSSLLECVSLHGAGISVSNWLEFEDGKTLNGLDATTLSGMRKMMALGSMGLRGEMEDHTIAAAPWAIHCGLIDRRLLTPERCWISELDQYASEDTSFWFRALHGRRVAYTNRHTALYRVNTWNCRNQFDMLSFWIKSVNACQSKNIEYLKELGVPLRQRQCESLMRSWENLHKRALASKDPELAERTLSKTSYWLKKCQFKGAPIPIKVRKAFGVGTFLGMLKFSDHFSRFTQIGRSS